MLIGLKPGQEGSDPGIIRMLCMGLGDVTGWNCTLQENRVTLPGLTDKAALGSDALEEVK